ncbi:hypothetical protein Rleg9DRAFT_1726 [Rhizobium leguminosarum bv. trifolii WSM597]|uniref:N-acetyltransferase domain-containing protein n=1 Tax=Rhizobium leguminosarum bv. trifolii WSM597 TaxID=754764 RepID=I9N888_RHILT|nr:hypothetical protein Rleg9DRAFT_1726 [Rhizobium leguminosarum bv. trifolii WSM597]
MFGNLAQRCIEEIDLADYTLAEAKEAFRGIWKLGNLWALDFHGEPIGLIGFQRDEIDVGVPVLATFFVGKAKFFDPAVPSVRFGRKFMRKMQTEFDNLPVVSMCYGVHPEIERWYRLMGYRLAETYGVQRNFVLDPVRRL